MIFTFRDDNVLGTDLIEEESQEPFFATVPFAKFWSTQSVADTVAIYAIFQELKGKYTAAELNFKHAHVVNASFLQEQMDLGGFMDSFVNRKQCVHPFIGYEQAEYSWIVDAERMVCYESKTKRVAAETRWTTCPDKKSRLQLEIDEDDLDSMDAIVVTCIICEFARRRNKRKYRKGSFLDL